MSSKVIDKQFRFILGCLVVFVILLLFSIFFTLIPRVGIDDYQGTNYYKVTGTARTEFNKSQIEQYKYVVLNSLPLTEIDSSNINLPNSIISAKDKSQVFAYISGPGTLIVSDMGKWVFSAWDSGASVEITNLYEKLENAGYKEINVLAGSNVTVLDPSNMKQIEDFATFNK